MWLLKRSACEITVHGVPGHMGTFMLSSGICYSMFFDLRLRSGCLVFLYSWLLGVILVCQFFLYVIKKSEHMVRQVVRYDFKSVLHFVGTVQTKFS